MGLDLHSRRLLARGSVTDGMPFMLMNDSDCKWVGSQLGG